MQIVDDAVVTKVSDSIFPAGSNPVRFRIQSRDCNKVTVIFTARLFKEPERHMKLIVAVGLFLMVLDGSHLDTIRRFLEERSDYYESYDELSFCSAITSRIALW